ncbi:MAG: efflux transporter outer membrane subunit [Terriglobia bacterium]
MERTCLEKKQTALGVFQIAMGAILLIGLIAGCTVGPDYHRPHILSPASWSSPMEGGETNFQPIDAAWWKTFHDPKLNSLIFRAVQSNLALRVAEARIREARAQRGVVASGEGPGIGVRGSYSRNRFSKNGFPPLPPSAPLDYNLYSVGFDASWELDLFGGIRRAVESANARIAVAEFGRDDVLRSLLGEVARNYIEARAFQRRIAITRENIQTQQRIVNLTRDRYHSGLASDLDVQQAEALLATTKSQVPTFETGFRNATYRLDVLLGQPTGNVLNDLSEEAPIPATPPQVPVGLPSDLLLRRPDVRRAERELAAATAQIGVAKADLFPRFSLIGDIGLLSLHTSDWWSAGSRFWSAGPIVSWPVFQSGRIRANVHVQEARAEQALAQYQQTILIAFEDVDSALTAYAKEQIRRQSLVQSVQANKRALKLADNLYRHGLADFIRVLESQRGLYQAQDSLVQSDQFVALNLVAIYKALGGGWKVDEAGD